MRAAIGGDSAGSASDAGADYTLNGAQITAAVDVITQLRQKTIAVDAALELLVAVGIPRERAKLMVEKTLNMPKLKTTEPTGE